MAMSEADTATAGTTCPETVNTQKSKERRKEKKKKIKYRSIANNMSQALQKWCLSYCLPHEPCDT